jgi:hypothetical protein
MVNQLEKLQATCIAMKRLFDCESLPYTPNAPTQDPETQPLISNPETARFSFSHASCDIGARRAALTWRQEMHCTKLSVHPRAWLSCMKREGLAQGLPQTSARNP